MKQRRHPKKNNRQQFLLDAVSSFFAVLFSFFFIFAQGADSGNTSADCETEDGSTSVAGAHFTIDHNQPFHFPLSSFPTPPEQEVNDGRETSDHSDDDDDGKLFTSLSLNERFNLGSHKCLLLQLLSSRENRKEVSLFILHHSWKSFLS